MTSGTPAIDPGTGVAGSSGTESADTSATAEGQQSGRRRIWHRVRTALSVGLLGAAVAILITRFGSLEKSASQLRHVSPGWLGVAALAEAGSMLAFGRLQQRLLRAGGSVLSLPTMVAITTASNAITGTMPGGVAWAAAWLYDQLGSRGVPRFLRVWAFLVAGGLSSFALFIVIAAGVEIAGSHGPVASLRWLVFLLALIPIAALVLEATRNRRPVAHLVRWAETRVENDLPGGSRLLRAVRSLVAQFTAVHLGPLCWAEVLALALANWLFDCVVVIASLEALGVPVPWDGILVIYGLTQISASIPITPGGIGVVAGSMTALLHAYGVPTSSALSVVLLYRIVSFWILVPIGWGIWSVLEISSRHRRLHPGNAPVPVKVGADTEPAPAAGSS